MDKYVLFFTDFQKAIDRYEGESFQPYIGDLLARTLFLNDMYLCTVHDTDKNILNLFKPFSGCLDKYNCQNLKVENLNVLDKVHDGDIYILNIKPKDHSYLDDLKSSLSYKINKITENIIMEKEINKYIKEMDTIESLKVYIEKEYTVHI